MQAKSTANNHPAKLRRVCAWCSAGRPYECVIEDGDPDAPATHGICEPCQAQFKRLERGTLEPDPWPTDAAARKLLPAEAS